MNRREIENWIGHQIYLAGWPFTTPVNTAEGNQYGYRREDKAKMWILLKITKGGMAMITDGTNTLCVPPYYVTDRVALS